MSEVASLKREIAALRELARAAVLVRKVGKATEAIDAAFTQYHHDNPDATRSLTMVMKAETEFQSALKSFDEAVIRITAFYDGRGESFAELVDGKEALRPSLIFSLAGANPDP